MRASAVPTADPILAMDRTLTAVLTVIFAARKLSSPVRHLAVISFV
jgi:hypothetical protein